MSGYDDGPRWPERDIRRDPDRDPDRDSDRESDREPDAPQPRAPDPARYNAWTPRPPDPEPEQPEVRQPEAPNLWQPRQAEPPPPEAPPQEPQRDLRTPEIESAAPTTSLGDPGPPQGGDGGGGGGDGGDGGGDGDDPDGPDDEGGGYDPRRQGDRRKPTTAEQAVPWLIGLLLALTGIVVVLLALIFVGPEGVATVASPTPSPTPLLQSREPFATATPSPTPIETSTPPPTFGALEMVYLGRSTANAPIRLSRRDFTTTAEPVVIAEAAAGVGDYTWAPDGRVGAAIIGGAAVALEAGQEPRPLLDAVDALAFADDSTTLYGLRITSAGANDRAEVLTIQFETGATEILTSITYPHPEIFPDPPLKEAQFADNGGIVRLYATIDGHVVAWILGAPAIYRIDPADGTYVEAERQPVLWSPDQRLRIDVTLAGSVTTLTLRDRAEAVTATVTVTGLVSHIRWAATNNEIVFTLGRTVGGGVRQDLYIWDLVDGKAPAPLTSNGASFGAEWLGVLQSWLP